MCVIDSLIYAGYIIFFACLFLTNQFFLAYDFFLLVLAPLALIPIRFERIENGRNPVWFRGRISFDNPRQTLAYAVSPVFIGLLFFGLALVLSSALAPDFSFIWFRIFFGYLCAICLFVLITARLTLVFEDFTSAFFCCFCIIVAINATINISLYFGSLDNLADFANVRFSPTFGRAPDHYFTTGALSYATAFTGSVLLVLSNNSRWRRLIGLAAGTINFSALCLTQSRGPLFAALASILICGFVASRDRRVWSYVATAILGGGLFLLVPEFNRSLVARADNHRLEIWRKFTNFALERPVLGYGSRVIVFFEISNGEKLGHAHNIFISALLRGGGGALISLLWTYAASVIRAVQLVVRRHQPITLAVLLTTLLAGIVDFDQMIFLSDWQWAGFWMPLGLAIGADQSLKTKPV